MPATPNPTPYTIFELRVSKNSDTSPEAMAACLQALPRIPIRFYKKWLKTQTAITLEIVTWHQRIYFIATIPNQIASFFQSQLTAQYPQASITNIGDYMPFFFPPETDQDTQLNKIALGQLTLDKPYYFPLKTYLEFKDIDPLTTVLGTLAKSQPQDRIVIQYLINNPSRNWQNYGKSVANTPIPTSDPEKTIPHPQKALIETKVSQIGFNVGINLLVVSDNKLKSEAILESLSGSYASISLGEGNSLSLKYPYFWQKKGFFQSIQDRQPLYTPRSQILTSNETATLFHLPNQLLNNIKNIAWGGTLKGEPPENLPISDRLSDDEKQEINFFAKTEFKSEQTVFGIKTIDRRKHVYIIGKTGVGKSTLIANMAINDMRNNKGMAIIDPHGDLIDTVLDYIPSHRLNDIVYLNPNQTDQPFRLNPLEVSNPEQAELVSSGIVAIFHKLFAHSWGPRLEYILRNTLLTLTNQNDTTLLDVTRLLTDNNYRKRIIEKEGDPVLKNFWINEFGRFDSRQQTEAVSPILNKIGQFITSPKIRMILERPHSSVDLEDVMNSGKILLLNLSQGLIGEDNASLLGAMFITKIQLAAMNRVTMPEADRKDFYLYVDEFQNFATSSFVKILSEARKYRLNLTVANQYTAQVQEDIQKAIFGNVGTLVSFLLGSSDATLINQEFGSLYDESDLVNLDNYEIITKLSIDNRTSAPFPAKTLPLPYAKNQNREKAIRLSNERYGKPDKKAKPKPSQTKKSNSNKSQTPDTNQSKSSNPPKQEPKSQPPTPQPKQPHELLNIPQIDPHGGYTSHVQNHIMPIPSQPNSHSGYQNNNQHQIIPQTPNPQPSTPGGYSSHNTHQITPTTPNPAPQNPGGYASHNQHQITSPAPATNPNPTPSSTYHPSPNTDRSKQVAHINKLFSSENSQPHNTRQAQTTNPQSKPNPKPQTQREKAEAALDHLAQKRPNNPTAPARKIRPKFVVEKMQ